MQTRSTISVDALPEATIQVLLSAGKEGLTTTRVAARAGVSVGTLYQYFPNKSSLLQAALRRHLDEVTGAIERVCREQKGQPVQQMMSTLITAFLAAKMQNPKTSVALYAVSSDVDGAKMAKEAGVTASTAIIAMLETAPEHLTKDVSLVASMLHSAMTGVNRRLLESPTPEKDLPLLREELIFFAATYLQACTQHA